MTRLCSASRYLAEVLKKCVSCHDGLRILRVEPTLTRDVMQNLQSQLMLGFNDKGGNVVIYFVE